MTKRSVCVPTIENLNKMVYNVQQTGKREASLAAKILVVSRDGKIETVLSREGFAVITAHLTHGASFRARTELPNMVILGSDLTAQESFEIHHQLRNNPVTKAIPVLVILPAGSEDGSRAHQVPVSARDDYLTEPYKVEVLLLKVQTLLLQSGFAVPKVEGRKSTLGRVVTLFSAKGGVGKTVIAANLAVALRRITDQRIILMDGNLQFGDLGKVLNLTSNKTIHNAMPFITTLDSEFLQGILVPYSTGVSVLLPPSHPAAAEAISVEFLQKIIWHLKSLADYLIIDTPVSYDAKTLALMDASDIILVLTLPEISVVANTETFLQLASDLEILNRVFIVVNRAGSKVGVTEEQLRRKFGRMVIGSIVSDGHVVVQATNRGEPFVVANPRAQVSQDIYRLAEYIVGGEVRYLPPPTGGGQRTLLWALLAVAAVILLAALGWWFFG